MTSFGYSMEQHPLWNKQVVHLFAKDNNGKIISEVKICPEHGCNLFSLIFNDQEYLIEQASYRGQPMMLGIPMMYPFPNRMKNARFTFEGMDYTFLPNDGDNYLHGMVMTYPFQSDAPILKHDCVSIHNVVDSVAGTDLFQKFPIANRLEVTYTLFINSLKIDFQVTNLDSRRNFPFGLGIHPYLNVIGTKDEISILVPAAKWMESNKLLPTGKLMDLDQKEVDLRSPKQLSKLNLDDVYWGMKPDSPQIVYFSRVGKQLTFSASEIFTHSCVFAPADYPIFCLENQTCSADAHNLWAKGYKEESHLIVLAPSESISGSIQLTISDL